MEKNNIQGEELKTVVANEEEKGNVETPEDREENKNSEATADETAKNDDSKDADQEKEEDDGKNEERSERPVYQMSVQKHQAEKNKWREKEAEYKKNLDEANRKLQELSVSSMTDDEVTKFADDNGLDGKAVAGLIALAEKKLSAKLPADKIAKVLQEQEFLQAKSEAEAEFEKTVVGKIKKDFPTASSEHLIKVKNELLALAFTKKYNTYPLTDIYAVNKDKFAYNDNYTAESSSGKSAEYVNYESVSDADIEKMSPQEYFKYSEYMAKKQGRWSK